MEDLFSEFGEISVRKMFGGAGVYCDGLIFAIIGDDSIWFKTDAETRAAFKLAGASPFVFETRDGAKSEMSYFSAPEEIFDEADALHHWTMLALGAAVRAGNKRKPRVKRSTPEVVRSETKIANNDLGRPAPSPIKKKKVKRSR